MLTSKKCSDKHGADGRSGMIKTLVSFVVCVGLLVIGAEAQRPKTKPTPKPAANLPLAGPAIAPAFPGYTFIVEIAADKSVRIQAVTGYESWAPGPDTLKKALAEYIAMQEPKLGQVTVPARVVVRAASSLDMKTLIEFLKTARDGASELSVEVTEFYSLKIPPEPKVPVETDVKPNPLFLLAAFDDKGAVTLNNEPYGSMQDLSVIQLKLKNLFKEREANGVFRENTNEIEKTVFVRVPESAMFADVRSFAKALGDIGSDHLWLAIEKIDWIEERPELIDLEQITPIPPNQPKPRPKRNPNE